MVVGGIIWIDVLEPVELDALFSVELEMLIRGGKGGGSRLLEGVMVVGVALRRLQCGLFRGDIIGLLDARDISLNGDDKL